ncbi:transmembrane protein 253 [Myxocyprinus asiaticus]|uniref:transmembrane protein 253 n=1 Tax=Myxocyprinus asiaticus TaxID=70543 RepID=UPI002223CCAB|nr:transmembrane protein 253 [Myxocyprinus asiaticus]
MPGFPEMTQNMFQEGLYQVFFKERPLPRPVPAAASTPPELKEARLVRWFGTVINTRLLLFGVVQIFSAVSCILCTISYTCLSFGCSVSMSTPVWCGLLYVITGSLTIDVQRKPKKIKVITLMGLIIVSLLFAVCSFITFILKSTALGKITTQQRIGVYVVKGSCILFILQCMVAAMYILFLTWRGLRSYSAPYRQDYSRVMQEPDEHADPLLDNEHFSL